MSEKRGPMSFEALLAEALEEPGKLSEAYHAFHQYSVGNAWAAAMQCRQRGIPIGPIATFNAWKEKGRSVKPGEKALWLCMPLTGKRKPREEGEEEETFTFFAWKPRWFALSQTHGDSIPDPVSLPSWDETKALESLSITKETFEYPDGNVQGYAHKRSVAVSPLAYNPARTLIHELAHVVLGHTEANACEDTATLDQCDRELEAEGTAYLVCSILGIAGLEHSRGYLQAWNKGRPVSEKTAARIFKCADRILKAGQTL